MKFTSAVTSLLAIALPVLAQTESLSYDTTYDNADLSLDSVACSDGHSPMSVVPTGDTTIAILVGIRLCFWGG
jgi:hypothetical protein